jgi:uncharacterized membrane protein YkvA (DUF1232 family)
LNTSGGQQAGLMLRRLKPWALALKRDVKAIYLASRDARVPWYSKALAGAVAAYALSPIDLIPDFIPVLGYLDDLIVVPLGVALVVRLIPPEVMEEYRIRATDSRGTPVSFAGATGIVLVWIVAVGLGGWLACRYWA